MRKKYQEFIKNHPYISWLLFIWGISLIMIIIEYGIYKELSTSGYFMAIVLTLIGFIKIKKDR